MGLLRFTDNGTAPGRGIVMWCPGCEHRHRVVVDSPNGWTWDGNEDAPTISPSIMVSGVQWPEGDSFRKPTHPNVAAGQPTCCHSFIVAGQWQFLGDCTHALAGQTVPMVPLPDGQSETD